MLQGQKYMTGVLSVTPPAHDDALGEVQPTLLQIRTCHIWRGLCLFCFGLRFTLLPLALVNNEHPISHLKCVSK